MPASFLIVEANARHRSLRRRHKDALYWLLCRDAWRSQYSAFWLNSRTSRSGSLSSVSACTATAPITSGASLAQHRSRSSLALTPAPAMSFSKCRDTASIST